MRRVATNRSKARALRAAICAITLSIGAIGCAAPRAHVAQGESYSTGNATYDEFFAQVREVRFQAISAEADERAAHAGLISALGLEPATPANAAIDEAQVRAKRLHDDGVLLHLELTPDAKLVAVRNNKDIGPEMEAVLKAVESSTKTSLEMGTRLGAIAARAAELEKRRIDLRAQAPSTFRGEPQARRDEITFELDAAAAVLASASDAGSRYAGAASKFAIDLARAVETGAASAPPEPPPGKQARVPGRKPPAAALAAPPRPAPVADAKPPAAKPPGDAKPAKPPSRPVAAPAKPPPAAAAPPPAKKGKPDDFEP